MTLTSQLRCWLWQACIRLGLAGILVVVHQFAGGCDSTSVPAPLLPTTTMQIGSKTFTIEIALKDPDRRKGLMDRPSLPADRGMLFIFEDERPREFWMKNVSFALDIIFLDSNAKVVSIKRMKEYDLTGVPSDAPAQYAIELNAGVAATTGVKVGDQIKLPAAATNPAAATSPGSR